MLTGPIVSALMSHYATQAGSGFPAAYAGVRYQRGNGWMGTFIKGKVWPLLKSVLPYLGEKFFSTGQNIVGDVVKGSNILDSVKSRLADTGLEMGADGFEALKRKRRQKGSGQKRRRVVKSCITKQKRRRRTVRRKVIRGRKRRSTNTTGLLF